MSLLNPLKHLVAVRELLALLTKHRQLTWEMSKREVTDRYTGQILGVLWAVGHPLILMAVYIFVFAVVFQARMASRGLGVAGDFTLYLLSGLIPWLTTQDALNKSCTAITANASLVKQVVFPIEILPVKGVLASYATLFISTVLLVLYAALRGHLTPMYLMIPVLHVVQVIGLIGISYLFSAAGAYFRDLKEIVMVFCIVSMYTMPLFYQPNQAPESVRFVFYLNPFSYMIWCYQDACYLGRFEHPWSWAVLVAGSSLLFCLGYRVFRRLKVYFGSVL